MSNIGREIQDFYCNGFFGREYDNSGSRIIAEGHDWITIRTIDGVVRTAQFEEGWQLHDMQSLIDRWCTEEEYL